MIWIYIIIIICHVYILLYILIYYRCLAPGVRSLRPVHGAAVSISISAAAVTVHCCRQCRHWRAVHWPVQEGMSLLANSFFPLKSAAKYIRIK